LFQLDQFYASRRDRSLPITQGEMEVAREEGCERPDEATVCAFLDKAQKHFLGQLTSEQESLEASIRNLRKCGIAVDQSEHSLVDSPDEDFTHAESAESHPNQQGSGFSRVYVTKLQQLISGLPRVGVFKEDLAVEIGAAQSRVLRGSPYMLLTIKSLDKEILVCNQHGEATFVSDTCRGVEFYSSRSKGDLKKTEGIHTVCYRNGDQWFAQIVSHLFPKAGPDRCATPLLEVDVVPEVVLRVREDPNMTAEVWANMKQRERNAYKAPGTKVGLRGLASQIGVKGSPTTNSAVYYELGIRIFGPDPLLVQKRDESLQEQSDRKLPADELKRRILEDGAMTAEDWCNMNRAESRSFRVPGTRIALLALSTRLGIKGDPNANLAAFYETGIEIFGRKKILVEKLGEAAQRLDDARLAKEEILEKIKADPEMDQERWIQMSIEERRQYRVPGTALSLYQINKTFHLSGRPTDSKALHLELGEAIFGKGSLVSHELAKEEAVLKAQNLDARVLRDVITNQMTYDDWNSMSQRDKTKYKVPGTKLGLNRVARKFSVSGNPVANHQVHLELGKAIFEE
ncbi:MAG: hypothetical protein KDD70_18320, partial [Bdellovibrionales bacterium]|nr:hypothetical protein [Bdellovibrionales bacterium]